ncbi:MAG: hypothetical protein WCT85_06750 [Parachlamydiales bacterium]|jgi:hypothetical protein
MTQNIPATIHTTNNIENITDKIRRLPKVVKVALAAISMLSSYAFLPVFLYPISFCAIIFYTTKIWNPPVPPRTIETESPKPLSIFRRIYNYFFSEERLSETPSPVIFETSRNSAFYDSFTRTQAPAQTNIYYTVNQPSSTVSGSRQTETYRQDVSSRVPVGTGQLTPGPQRSQTKVPDGSRIPVGTGQITQTPVRQYDSSSRVPVGSGQSTPAPQRAPTRVPDGSRIPVETTYTPAPRTAVRRQESARVPVGNGEITPRTQDDRETRIQIGSRT